MQLFIPFTLAILCLISHQYELDPILVFLGQSETTPFRTLAIKEPYVGKLLLGRAIWVSALVATLAFPDQSHQDVLTPLKLGGRN